MSELEKKYYDFIKNFEILTSYDEQFKKIETNFTIDEIRKILLGGFATKFDDADLKEKSVIIFNFLTAFSSLDSYSFLSESVFYAKEDLIALQKASDMILRTTFYGSALKYFIAKSDLKSVQMCIENAKNDGIKEEQINTILDKFGYADLVKKEQETKTDEKLDVFIQLAQSLKGKELDQEQLAQMFQQLADNFKTNTVNNGIKNDKQAEASFSPSEENLDNESPKNEENPDNEIPKSVESDNEKVEDTKKRIPSMSKIFDPNANILDNVQRLLDLQSLPPKYSQMQTLINQLTQSGASNKDLKEYVEKYINDKIVGKYSVDSFKYLKALAVKCACENSDVSEKKYSVIALRCFAKSMGNIQKSSKSKEEKLEFLKQKYDTFRGLACECVRCGNDKEVVENIVKNYDLAIDVDKMFKNYPEIMDLLKKREEATKKQELEKIFSSDDDVLDETEDITLRNGDLQSLASEIKSRKFATDNDSLAAGKNKLDDLDDKYNPYSEEEIVAKESATPEEKIGFGRRLKSALNILWNGKTPEIKDGKGGK